MKRTILICILLSFLYSGVSVLNASELPEQQDTVTVTTQKYVSGHDILTNDPVNVNKLANAIFIIVQFMATLGVGLLTVLAVMSEQIEAQAEPDKNNLRLFEWQLSILTPAFAIMAIIISIANYCLRVSNDTKDIISSTIILLITTLLITNKRKINRK